MVTRQELSYLAVIAFSVTIICLPLILFGPQAGHSLYHNISWAAGFAEQLLAGDLYPRWLMNMNEGAGSPVFFFYAPIPFYFTSLGFLLCGECSTTIQLGIGPKLSDFSAQADGGRFFGEAKRPAGGWIAPTAHFWGKPGDPAAEIPKIRLGSGALRRVCAHLSFFPFLAGTGRRSRPEFLGGRVIAGLRAAGRGCASKAP